MKLTIQEIQDIETEMLKEVVTLCEKHEITYYLAYGTVLGAVRHKGPIPWDSDVDIYVPIDEMNKFVKTMQKSLSEKFYVSYAPLSAESVNLFPKIGLKGYSAKILHIDVFMVIGAPDNYNKQKEFKEKLDKYKLNIQYKNLKEGYFSFHKISLKEKLFIYLKAMSLFFVPKTKIFKDFMALCHQYSYEDSTIVTNATGGYAMKEFIPKKLLGNGVKGNYEGMSVIIPEQTEEYLKHFYNDYRVLPPKNERVTNKSFVINKLK